MRTINVKSVKDGMVLAESIENARGNLLMDKGSTLREAFITRLTQWGISTVCVEGNPEEEEKTSAKKTIGYEIIPLEKIFEGKIVNDAMHIIYEALIKNRG